MFQCQCHAAENRAVGSISVPASDDIGAALHRVDPAEVVGLPGMLSVFSLHVLQLLLVGLDRLLWQVRGAVNTPIMLGRLNIGEPGHSNKVSIETDAML